MYGYRREELSFFLPEVIQINIIWLNLLPRISQSNVCNWPSIIRLTSEIEHNRIIVSLSWHSGYIISNRSLSTRTVDCGLRTTRTNLQQRPFLSRLALKRYSCIRKLKTSTLNSVYVLPFCRKISYPFIKIYLYGLVIYKEEIGHQKVLLLHMETGSLLNSI